jgi:hypothetical protein
MISRATMVGLAIGAALAAAPVPGPPVEVLKATGGLPARIVGQFEDPIGFAEASTGDFVVLDRRAHTVWGVDARKTTARNILQVGYEEGRVLRPGVLALSRDDIFAVADAPGGAERIQYFSLNGSFLGGFNLQSQSAPRLVIGPLVVNGVGSMSFTGKTFLVSRPETGALFTEYDNHGEVVRYVGHLRSTGHERDPDLHVALNVGLPLADPTGGYVFVFQTGRPMFRKYDANGVLQFERHIEGPELDAEIMALPTDWPRRPDAGHLPLVLPLVRTAALDPSGRLWVSLMTPYTYVYDASGQHVRTVRFDAASVISPASFFFASGQRVLVTPGCYEFRTDGPGPR